MSNVIVAFNNKLEINTAFTWNKDRVRQFFKDLGDNPTAYGVPSQPVDYSAEAKAAATAFDTLSKATTPFSTLGTGVKLHYGSLASTPFEMYTIFDIMGWIFSIASTPPSDADMKSFYFPLTALFCKFCALFTTPAATGDIDEIPTMLSVISFVRSDGVRQALWGANLDNPDRTAKKKPKKNGYQEARRVRLVGTGWITAQEKAAIETLDGYPSLVAWKYGHCAETYPFMFLKNARDYNLITDKTTIRGVAVSPSRYGLEATTVSYVEADLKKGLTPPCLNCAHLVLKQSLNLDQFAVNIY